MTEQRAVTDCTPPEAHPQTPPPLTRRELRAAQQRLEAATAPGPADEPTGRPDPAVEVTRPVSRRTLGAAAASDTVDLAEPIPAATPTAGPAWPLTTDHVLVGRPADSRRALRTSQSATPLANPPSTGSSHGPIRRLGRIVTVVSLVTTLGVTGFTFQRESAEARTAAATQSDVQAQIARTSAATTARLTAEATAYADGRHAMALEAAQAALAQTDTVVQTAAPVLDTVTLTPLQEAAAALAALVGAAGGATLSTAGAQTTAAEVDGVTPTAAPEEVLRAAAASRASRSESTGRPPLATASEDAATPSTDADVDPDVDAGTVDQDAPIEDSPPVDLETSARMMELAARVAQLTTEVQSTVDAKVAEEQARELAQAAAAAAAAEMARKVEIAEDARNGEIPASVLCAPSFAPQELVRCDAAQALEHLNVAYEAEFGKDLDIVSSYRSYATQISTRRSRGWLAAQPGTSNHGLALAVDFGSFGSLGSFSHPSYRWMKIHAGAYGWFHPSFMERGGGGPQEPWHWEFGTL